MAAIAATICRRPNGACIIDIFKTRPEAGAIVHTHSIYATALACLRKDIPAFHYMIGIAGGTSLARLGLCRIRHAGVYPTRC